MLGQVDRRDGRGGLLNKFRFCVQVFQVLSSHFYSGWGVGCFCVFGVEFCMKELGSPLTSPLKHIGLASIFMRLLVYPCNCNIRERCAYPESM